MADKIRPFHLAFPVHDLSAAAEFYEDLLGCERGRSSEHWTDYNLFGHQIVAHFDPSAEPIATNNTVDGANVPVPHFGVVLTMDDWQELADRLESKGTDFIISPTIRFRGKAGEQATMFFCDPSGNALEFKAFRNDDQLFATD